MNEHSLLSHPLAARILLTVAWQSTLWLAIGLVAARIWRRRAGRAHLLLILATAAALISPLLTETVRRMEWGVLPPPSTLPEDAPVVVVAPPEPAREVRVAEPGDVSFDELRRESREPGADQRAEPVREEQVATLPPPKTEPEPEPEAEPAKPAWTAGIAERTPAAVAGVWLCASLILAIRLIFSLFSGGRIARGALKETSPHLLESLRDASGALGLRSPPLLRVSPLIRCPMIWCWGVRPVVLLPDSAAQQPQILWRSVFCHELAHLVRRDHWSALWAELLTILVPWQPLAWRARRRLAFLREQACDDWVLAVGGEATDYAESLLQLVPQGSPVHALAAVSSRESLKRRLEHVLAGVRIAPKVGRRWVVAASLFALAAIAGVGFAQQGKRSPVANAEPASNAEIAIEVQPPTATNASTASAFAPTMRQMPKADTPKPEASSGGIATPVSPTIRQVRGRVLLPHGQPAVGASVRVVRSMYGSNESPYDEVKVIATFTADSQGEFRASFDARVMNQIGRGVSLWAALSGYGLAVHPLVPNEKADSIVMRLAEEQPIRGRIIDLEGRPVRDARVEAVRYVNTATAAIDEWLASAAGKEKPVRIAPDKLVGGQPASLDWARNRRDTAILHVDSIEVVSEAIVPTVKTNADGRFELKGIGRDRLVVLRISAPRSTTVFPVSLTRPLRSNPFPPGELSGPDFERVAPPSAPVEGFVTDEEIGKPVPGAVMNPHLWHQAIGLAGNFAITMPATADATGHYRLEGLDRLNTNMLTVAPGDSPYFGGSARVPVAKGLEPTHVDIKLKRGVWARGRAYDQVTGKPVDGHVAYSPSSSNKLRRGFSARSMRGAQTDAAGQFRVLVLPGRGMVYLSCKGDYRFNAGAKELRDARSFSEVGINRFCEIDVPTDASEAHVDLLADPGHNVVLKFTDAAGKPLAGVDAYGLRYTQPRSELGYARTFSAGDTAILYAVSPEDVRRVWFRHRASGLNKMFRFKQMPGETERTIVLDPPAIVTGRFVTPEGKPILGLSVSCGFNAQRGGPATIPGFPDVPCDTEGRFRRDLPAGDWISLVVAPDRAVIVRPLTVASGELIDLGDITIERDPKRPGLVNARRGPEKRTKPPAAIEASASAPASVVSLRPKENSPKPAAATAVRVVRGRVLLPNGQPAVGATVRAMTAAGWPRSWPEAKGRLLGTFSTNAEGRFEGKVSAPLGTRPEWATRSGNSKRGISISGVDVNLWATLPGYGVALVQLESVEGNDQIVMNLAEDEPIRGHLIDLEGRPIRDARVEVLRFSDPTAAAIDQWLASLQGVKPEYRKNPGVPSKSSDWVPDGLWASVKADSDGRFELKGVGRDRNVTLRISAPQVTTILAYVLTRPMKPIQFKYFEIFGSQFERIVPPSVPVEGFVTDEETGKPIPRAQIFPTAVWRDTVVQGFGAYVSAVTDARGHYRLEGLETVTTNEVGASVLDLPYPQANQIVIPPARSPEPIRKDIKLRRGVWAAGRAYDRTTGKPVSGTIFYTPFESNRFADKFDHQFNFSGKTEDASGHFRVQVIPGRGVVCLQCSTGDYRFDFGKSEIKEFAPPKPSQRQTRMSDLLASDRYNSVRAIDVPPNAEEVHVDLPVDPGQNVVLKFTDAAGKALAGIETYGLRFPDSRLRGQSFVVGNSATLYATSPDESRHIWLRHRASGLTKQFKFTPKAGETERVIVLEPSAVVTGRVVSPEGGAISGIPIGAYGVVPGGLWPSELMSDRDGRFRIEFPAGGPFSLHSQWTKLADDLRFDAGEQVDLRDIAIERGNNRFDAKVHRGPAKRTKATGTAKASTVSAPPSLAHPTPKHDIAKPSAPTTIRELRGRVLLPNGQPAVGATVRAMRAVGQPYPAATDVFTVLTTLSADAKGEFRGSFDVGPMTDRRDSVNLWATLPGYGLALHPLMPAQNSDPIDLHLAEDEPIRGNIINLEGRPIRDARIEVITFYDSTAAWVDEFIASAKDKPLYIGWLFPNRSLGENRGGREEAVFRVKSVASVSEALIPPQKTNSDGRFEIQGIGRDRHVYLKISGPRMATFVASVVTRPIKPIPFEFQETFGSQFERVASPCVPVDGSVTDEETGQPIAGVRIRPYAVKRGHTILQGGNMFVSATSDSLGHFRLEGLDTGLINLCRIEIPDLPYLSASEATIPASVALAPIRLDIKLKRAIWAVGRAYDRSTGKPVSGVVSYTPFRSNELAAKYFSAQNPFLTSVNTGVVDADGRFRLAVIPGRGVVCLRCTNGLYRFDLGRTTIKELATAKRSQSPTLALLPANSYHSLHEINVAQDAREVNVDLPVEPGQNVVLKFTDAAGKPLSGVEAVGLVLEPRMLPPRSFTESDSATLYGTFPGDIRSVRLRHRASGLTKLFQFTPQPGETERTIVLEPPAVVTGRLVSDDGTPLSNIKLEFYTLVSSTLVALPPLITDAKGHFRQELPTGEPFNLKAGAFQPGPLVDRLTVAAGEQIDLGTITIERGPRERGFPNVHRDAVKRTKPLATAKASTASTATSPVRPTPSGDVPKRDTPIDDGPWLIRGTVLRSDGKPAAGAQVLAIRRYWSNRVSWQPMAMARAAAKGDFEIHVPRPGYDGLGSGLLGLAARVDGFGIEWARGPSFDYGKKPSSPVVLRLVPECPIHGRVVDLEGRPVSGVHVRVLEQFAPKEGQDLGPLLDVVKKGVVNASLGSWLPGYEDGTSPPNVSDRDGRFAVTGIGAERMVRLQVDGETIASAQFDVVTRSMKSLGPTGLSYDPTQVFGKDFTYQAAPTKPITGTVRDAVTGKPLAGVHLELSRQKFIGSWSDAEGKFRLVGMPKTMVSGDKEWNRNRLIAMPNLDQPYFGNEVDIPQTAGLDPVTLDIKLKRGLWITGRVTDKITGKPVHATVHYFPYGSNPFVKPDEWRTIEKVTDGSHRITRPDGTYRIVGLPWRAIVGVRAAGGMYLTGVGACKIPGMEKNGRFPKTLEPAFASFENALKEINPGPGTESAACDLALDPGGKLRIAFVDGAGKPVEDGYLLQLELALAVTWGRRDATFELAGLAPKESRTYQITQWQRKIAKVFTFEYDEKASQTLTVKLEPCATVRGRLLDEEGSPLKNVQVFAEAMRNGQAWFSLYTSGPMTDADGHFAIENLAAGCDSYTIRALDPKRDFVTVAEKVSFAPGKTIDLGEIKLR
jgi:beta-lactamase regulating signal transducer with metallopeptidase domain